MRERSAPSRQGPPDPARTRLRWAAFAVVVLVLLFFGLREHWLDGRFRWDAFAAGFSGLEWQWILAALACSLAAYFGRALRWRVMLRPLDPSARIWPIFKATAIGFSAVVLLGRPGEFVRPYLISLKERVPFSSQLAAWLLERICDLLAVALVFGFAISRIWSSRAALGPALRWVLEAGGWVVMALSLVCLALLIMMGRFPDVVRRRLLAALSLLPHRFHLRAEHAGASFMDGTASTTSKGSAWLLIFYTAVEWLLVAAGFGCMFRAYSVTEAFTAIDVFIFMGFIAFGSVLQIPGVGGGLQLVAIVVLTQIFGLTIEVATSIAIMAWIITFVAIVPIGLWSLIRKA